MSRTGRRDLKARYGPWALVTGASSGIGREFARQLAVAGLNVILVARRRAELEALAAELKARHRIETIIHALDLADEGAASQLDGETVNLNIGLVVAAAGYGTSGAFLEVNVRDELRMIDVNCTSVVDLAHVFAPRLARRAGGGIVLMSSLVAFQGVPRAATYAATKAFIQVLAEGLQRELKPLGIDVIASAPGPIQSGFGARANMTMSMSQGPEVVARATLAALGRRGTVRPGWLSKLLEASLAPLPRWGRTRIMQQVMAGMTPTVKVKPVESLGR